MAIPGTIQLPGLSTTPSPPPSGSYVLYTKTDSTLNLEDNLGNVYTFGATNAITQLTGDVNAVGPGSVTSTIESIQGNSISGTTGTINVVFSHSPTLTGTITAAIANFSGAISASNFSGSSNGTNTGDVTLTNTNSIDLAFSSGQTGLSANLNLSAASPDAGYIPALSQIKSDGLLVEVLAGLPVQIGTSNNIGSAASASRSDHVHALTSSVVTGQLLTGYVLGTNTPLTATNTILQGFENLQAQISSSVGAAITSLTGDVLATGPGAAAATVVALQGYSVSNTAPTDAQILIWVSGTSKWTPTSVNGDATMSDVGNITVRAIQGNTVSSTTPTDAQILIYNSTSTQYAPESISGDGLLTDTGILTVTGLQTHSVSNTAPTDAQFLLWNSGTSKWTPTSISSDINIADTGVTTIQPNVVTNSKLAQAPILTLKGNNTGGTANVTDLTVSQVNTMLGDVTTIGTYDGNGSAANGLSISGNSLFAQSATVSNPGMVNTTTQSFAGNKTFTGTVAITPASTTALVIDTTAFIFDSVNNAFGIGIQPSTSVMIDGVNTSGASKLIQMTGYGVGSTTGYRGRFARGTSGSPSAVQSGDILNALSGRGYGASQFAAASTGVVNVVAGETFTNTSNLTYLQFSTTPTGSVTSAESMRVATTGVTLGPQSSSTAAHQINGSLAGTTRTVTASTLTVDTTTTDYIIYADPTSNTITITLPAPTNGRILVIEDSTGKSATNNITVNPHASEKINGASSFVISQNYGSIRLTSDGTNWFVQALLPNIAASIPPVIAVSASAIDWSTGNVFTKTLSANTTFTFSNQTAGQTIVVRLTNTASNYTVSWPTVRWPAGVAPTMSTGAVSDVYTFIYDGSNTYGSYVQAMS